VETVAEQVAAAVLRDFPAASAVAVRVVKPHVAMPGALHSLGAHAACRSAQRRRALRADAATRAQAWRSFARARRARVEADASLRASKRVAHAAPPGRLNNVKQ
jgi:hypothetical protein